jgi:pimeloyl-ACP methyl ester carboxylesterase
MANDPQSFSAINRMLLNMEIDQELSHITAKTLVIGCEYDEMRPPAMVKSMATLIPGAVFVEALSGHFMHAQTPALFTQMVMPFLLEK